MSDQLVCSGCAAENPGVARFCRSCGKSVIFPQVGSREDPGSRRRGWLIGVAAVAVLAVVGALLVTSGDGGRDLVEITVSADRGVVAETAGGVRVEVPAGAVVGDGVVSVSPATASDRPPADATETLFKGLTVPLGEPIRVEVEGAELSGRVQLELPYDADRLPDGAESGDVFVVSYDDAAALWVPVVGAVDASRHVVVVETGHLSWWQVRTWNLDKLTDWFSDIDDWLVQVGGAHEVNCDPSPETVTVAVESYGYGESVLACPEAVGDGGTLVRVANNRALGLTVEYATGVQPQSLETGSLMDALWVLLGDRFPSFFGANTVYLPPGAEAGFLLPPGADWSEMRFDYRISWETLVIDMLVTALLRVAGASEMAAMLPAVTSAMDCYLTAVTTGGTDADFRDVANAALGCAEPLLTFLGTPLGVYLGVFNDVLKLAPAAFQFVAESSATGGFTSLGHITVTRAAHSIAIGDLQWARVPHDEAVFGGDRNERMMSVVAGGPGLVAVGWASPPDGSGDAAVWTSRNGVSWMRVPHDPVVFGGPGQQNMHSITAGGPGLVAVGWDFAPEEGGGLEGSAAVWTSADGVTWSRVPHEEAVFGGSDDHAMSSIAAGGLGFVAVGTAAWTSADGINWRRALRDDDDGGYMRSVAVGGFGLIAVGSDRSGGDSDAAVWTSTDGATWSRVAHDETVFGGGDDQSMNSVVAVRQGFVAVGTDGASGDNDAAMWTSTDGITWSRVAHDETVFGGSGDQEAESVATVGSGVVAVGHTHSGGDWDGVVWFSVDGVSWSRIAHDETVFGGPSLQVLNSLVQTREQLIAVGGDRAGGDDDAAVWLAVPLGDGASATNERDETVAATQIERILQLQLDSLNDDDIASLHATLAPERRATCTVAELRDWIHRQGLVGVEAGSPALSMESLQVEVTGDIATASYQLLFDGLASGEGSMETFVRIEGRWYDQTEPDEPGPCQ